MEEMRRRVQDSIVETVHMVRPNHLNGTGRLFGGVLMQWIDELAGIVAKRHTRTNVITASIDHLDFLHPAHKNDVVVLVGMPTYAGNTSMEVKVDTFVESLQGGRELINRAYFTMVALDENDKPTRLPRLIYETEEEKMEFANAKKRKEARVKKKRYGF